MTSGLGQNKIQESSNLSSKHIDRRSDMIDQHNIATATFNGSGKIEPYSDNSTDLDDDFSDLDLSVNKCYMIWFVLILNLTGTLLGYSVAYANQLKKCFDLKFDWGNGIKADTY